MKKEAGEYRLAKQQTIFADHEVKIECVDSPEWMEHVKSTAITNQQTIFEDTQILFFVNRRNIWFIRN